METLVLTLSLHTALFSPTLAAIANAGHRRTNQMQETHIDHIAFHLLT